jgi:hypothetical protein
MTVTKKMLRGEPSKQDDSLTPRDAKMAWIPSAKAYRCPGCGEEMDIIPSEKRSHFAYSEYPAKDGLACSRTPIVYTDYLTANGRPCCSAECVRYAERGERRTDCGYGPSDTTRAVA